VKKRTTLYLTVFFTSTSVLMFEVALTRIFSVMLWYHFAYVVISLCLLGLGAAGTYLSISKIEDKNKKFENIVLYFAIFYPLLMIFCFLIVTKLRIYPLQMFKDKSNIFTLFAIYGFLILPFFSAGTILGFIFSRYSSEIGKLYFFDLVGAGIGSLFVTLAINKINAPAAVMVAALISSFAPISFNFFIGSAIKIRKIIFLPIFCFLTVLIFLRWDWYIFVDPSKELFWSQHDPDVIEYSKWTTIARVDVVWEGSYNPTFGADVAPRYFSKNYRSHFISQDGVAPTLLFRMDKPLNKMFPFLKSTTQSGAYQIIKEPKVCTIGVGGGMDILVALGNNAKKITAVEVNPVMVYLCRERYVETTMNVFNDRKIKWVINEGRHFLASTDEKFDIIQLSGVDTFAALSSGAYVLSENYLYTTNAIKDIYERLTDNGIYSVSRWFFDPPRESLRLAVIVETALKEMGISEPEKHIFILHGARWATILLKKSLWTENETDLLKKFCNDNEFGIFFNPYDKTTNNPFEQYLRSNEIEKKKFIKTYRFNIAPVSDESPFFFQYYRWGEILGLHKKALGGILGYFITQTPQAFQTLAINLVQLTVLSFFLIIYPLKKNKLSWVGVKGKFGVILYFASLGIAFLFVEIVLIQRFIVYLGTPMYSLSTVLAGLLIFSGLGSCFTMTFKNNLKKKILILVICIAIVILLISFTLTPIIHLTLKRPILLKALITLLFTAPLGFLLGMPFPSGIKLIGEKHPQLIPWAWGINGYFSVISTMLSVLISSLYGFHIVFYLAAIFYLIGYSGLLFYINKNQFY